MRHVLALAAVLTAAAISPAAAQEVTAIGTFGKWTAFTYQEEGNQVCYMASSPATSRGAYKSRGQVMLLVTHRPAEKAFDVVSLVAGYQYQSDTDAEVAIGKIKFNLFTNGERAWARDAATDKNVVQNMVKGNALSAKGTSSRGTITTDTFSLVGFGAAYKAISDACKKPA